MPMELEHLSAKMTLRALLFEFNIRPSHETDGLILSSICIYCHEMRQITQSRALRPIL